MNISSAASAVSSDTASVSSDSFPINADVSDLDDDVSNKITRTRTHTTVFGMGEKTIPTVALTPGGWLERPILPRTLGLNLGSDAKGGLSPSRPLSKNR